MLNDLSKQKRLKPTQVLIIGFLILIITGTLCLMMPRAVNEPPLCFINVLLMATSASCVTGLVVVDPE